MENLIDFIKKDKFAANVGVVLGEIGADLVTATLTVAETHINAGGVCQGGAIFTLADVAVAAMANITEPLAFTMQSDVRFLQSAVLGDILTASCTEIMQSKRIAHYRVEVANQHGKLIAVVDAICYRGGKVRKS